MTFEGTCRDRTIWDKVVRWFGGGGLKGNSAIFDVCRIDATDAGNVACLLHPPFSDELQKLARRPGCRRIKIQAGGGVGPLLSWHAGSSSPDAVMSWIDQTVKLATTLDA